MATITSMARQQFNYAEMQTRYAVQLNAAKQQQNNYNISDTQSYDEFWENITKDKNGYIKQEYEKLYNSMFGKSEDEAESTVSMKQSCTNVMNSASELDRFAESLKYGEDYDTETAGKLIEGFVNDYNGFIENLGSAESESVLQKGVVMVNTAKVYSNALRRAGITVGSDNKLTFDPEKLSDVSATDLKTTFGQYGFAEKASQRAEQVSRLSGSAGLFGYTNASTQSYAYSVGALFSTYA